MTGPKLTQRKIDKLRDALNVVRECEDAQSPTVQFRINLLLGTLDDLRIGKAVLDIHHELGREKEA